MKINITKLKENAPTIINALMLLAVCIGIYVLDDRLNKLENRLYWEISDKGTSDIERQLDYIEKELKKQTEELEQWRLEREEQRKAQREAEFRRSLYGR